MSTNAPSSNQTTSNATDMEVPKRRFALAVGGSFNPVHRSHVKMLEVARDTLKALFGDNCIVGCYLAVAHGSHVRGKCGQEASMTNQHRLAMAAIACDEFGLNKADKCFASSLALLESLYKSNKDVVLVNVVGGDRAKPNKRGTNNKCNIMIGRKGSGHKKLEFADRIKHNKGHSDGIFKGLAPPSPNVMLDGNDMFIDVEDDVSSTAVRRALKAMESHGAPHEGLGALQELVDKGILSHGVADYIVKHWGKLYEADN